MKGKYMSMKSRKNKASSSGKDKKTKGHIPEKRRSKKLPVSDDQYGLLSSSDPFLISSVRY